MANHYTQATVDPRIPRELISNDDLTALNEQGFSSHHEGGLVYLFVEESFFEFEEHEGKSFLNIFQDICQKSDIEEIVIQGAYTCSKARPGEFGGFVTRITKDKVQSGDIVDLLEQFRKEV